MNHNCSLCYQTDGSRKHLLVGIHYVLLKQCSVQGCAEKTNTPGLEKIVTKHNLIALAGRKQLHWGWVALVMEQSSLQTLLCNLGNYDGSEQLLIFANSKCVWTSLRMVPCKFSGWVVPIWKSEIPLSGHWGL